MYAAMGLLAQETGRRVVVVLSDGMSSGSVPGWPGDFGEVRKRATTDGYMLYVIGMEGVFQSDDAAREFQELIEETGGGARFTVKRTDDLEATFVRVVEELRRQDPLGVLAWRRRWAEPQARGEGQRRRAEGASAQELRRGAGDATMKHGGERALDAGAGADRRARRADRRAAESAAGRSRASPDRPARSSPVSAGTISRLPSTAGRQPSPPSPAPANR